MVFLAPLFLQSNMAEMVSPLSIASQRLEEKKENVSEQLQVAENYLNNLCFQKKQLSSKLEEECNSIERDVSLLKLALDDKKNILIEELRSKREDEIEAASLRITFANEAISSTIKVSYLLL